MMSNSKILTLIEFSYEALLGAITLQSIIKTCQSNQHIIM